MLKDLVAGLWRRSRSRSGLSKTSRAEAMLAAAAVETLEQRRLLTALNLPACTFSVDVSLTSGGTVITTVIDGGTPTNYTKSLYTGIVVNGSSNGDTLFVNANVDLPVTVNGDDGDDTITGGGANDSLVGGNGNDTYKFSGPNALGTDTINEAANTDIDAIDFTGFSSAATIDLVSTTNQTVASGKLVVHLTSASGIENLVGTDLADHLNGNTRDNNISGGTGNDTIQSSSGNDTIDGGDGNDSIIGGDGTDSITGGADNDIIAGGDGSDTITGDDGTDLIYGGDRVGILRADFGGDQGVNSCLRRAA